MLSALLKCICGFVLSVTVGFWLEEVSTGLMCPVTGSSEWFSFHSYVTFCCCWGLQGRAALAVPHTPQSVVLWGWHHGPSLSNLWLALCCSWGLNVHLLPAVMDFSGPQPPVETDLQALCLVVWGHQTELLWSSSALSVTCTLPHTAACPGCQVCCIGLSFVLLLSTLNGLHLFII